MTDTYNGWINRETWCAALYLSNDQGLDEWCRELAIDAIAEAADTYPRVSLSSGHFSTDQQLVDVVDYLTAEHGNTFNLALITRFPEWETRTMGDATGSSWYDTDAMGVDPEWSSWVIDWVESDSRWAVQWEDGEPWADPDATYRRNRAAWIMGDKLRDQFDEWAADVVDGESTTHDMRMMLADIGSLYRVEWSDVAESYVDDVAENDGGYASQGAVVMLFVATIGTWITSQYVIGILHGLGMI